jgi:hypothetical protein
MFPLHDHPFIVHGAQPVHNIPAQD